MSIGWVASTARNARAVPWKLPRTVVGTPMRAIASSIARVACDSDTPAARLNEIVDATNWRVVIDGERRFGRRVAGEQRQRHLRAPRNADVHVVQRVGGLPEFGRSFHHDVVLVERRVDRRDQTLREGVVQRGVDQLRRHAETGRGVAIDVERGREPLVLPVGVDVDELGQLRERLADARLPGRAARSRSSAWIVYW